VISNLTNGDLQEREVIGPLQLGSRDQILIRRFLYYEL